MILGIFPSDILEPFASGNTLQIIFLAVVIGTALLFMQKQTREVAMIIGQINALVNFLMSLISHLVPFIIFMVMLSLIWSLSLRYGSLWVFFLLHCFSLLRHTF